MKRHSHALNEGSFPLGITHSEGKTSNGSPRQTSPSGRLLEELLMMAAETSYESGEEILSLQEHHSALLILLLFICRIRPDLLKNMQCYLMSLNFECKKGCFNKHLCQNE